jgi:hypothetical protein
VLNDIPCRCGDRASGVVRAAPGLLQLPGRDHVLPVPALTAWLASCSGGRFAWRPGPDSRRPPRWRRGDDCRPPLPSRSRPGAPCQFAGSRHGVGAANIGPAPVGVPRRRGRGHPPTVWAAGGPQYDLEVPTYGRPGWRQGHPTRDRAGRGDCGAGGGVFAVRRRHQGDRLSFSFDGPEFVYVVQHAGTVATTSALDAKRPSSPPTEGCGQTTTRLSITTQLMFPIQGWLTTPLESSSSR